MPFSEAVPTKCFSAWGGSTGSHGSGHEISRDLQENHQGQGLPSTTDVKYARDWLVLVEDAFYLMKDEARAPGSRARVTLTMCSNAAGFMLKPCLIYKAASPRGFKNKNKHLLPVLWMHNPKAWITNVLTSNWFIQSFIPQVKEYLKDLCMEFKVLLIMDNAGGHPLDLYYDRV
ncbi:tigger transposable element-derived protein 1-like [Macrobrachium rosenbergii]|uniref:tigger transposable element-derived protein 1-like n=1 Tax=Macrobrachium rosenbergii TaxID=79674 RepID=UPI0034D4AA5B